MLKAIIFDFDDTLLKTRIIKYQAVKYCGQKFYNLELSDADIDQHWGKPFLSFLSEVYRNIEPVEALAANYKSIVGQFKNEAYEGTLETIDALSVQYKLGILSSAAQYLVIDDMKSAGLEMEKFLYIQTAEDTAVHKPDPTVFQPLIRTFTGHGIGVNEMLYIGDTLFDWEAATKAGLHFIAMADRTTPALKFSEKGSKYITDLRHLPEALVTLK
ncbi:MAG TPA: HAD hydrolase-like protein [Vitreimonas sp.]|nr:HAD hydrolase-like protein [Vitreimonas sp.]